LVPRTDKPVAVVARPAWKSGKPACGFPLFHPGRRVAVGMWESRPPLARFPRGRGKRGKAVFAFPRFPRTRHFHGLPDLRLRLALIARRSRLRSPPWCASSAGRI
jgi:hypothetical protein